MQVISITVWTKNHKSQNQNSLIRVPLIDPNFERGRKDQRTADSVRTSKVGCRDSQTVESVRECKDQRTVELVRI